MKNKKYSPNVLIVDDQIDTLRTLEKAARDVFPKYYPNFKNQEIARAYNDAEDAISKKDYDFVLLDHRMPREPMKWPDMLEKGGSLGDLNEEELEKYFQEESRVSSSIEDIGYKLIPEIKGNNYETTVIGTSSAKNMSPDVPSPDYSINKIGFNNAVEGLEKILTKLREVKK